MNGGMLVFGAGGQVGHELIAPAGQRGVPAMGLKRELFLDNPEKIPTIAYLADVLAPLEAALAEALLRIEVELCSSQNTN